MSDILKRLRDNTHLAEENNMSESAEALRLKYGHWGAHPDYPVADWVYEVTNNYTRLGYWEWVANLEVVEKEEMGEAAADEE